MIFPNSVEECKKLLNEFKKHWYASDSTMTTNVKDTEVLHKLNHYNMTKISNIIKIMIAVHPNQELKNFAHEQLLEINNIMKCKADTCLRSKINTDTVDHQSEFKYPTKYTLSQIIKVFRNIFQVEIHKETDMCLWHHDVVVYRITRKHQFIGHIILDLYPREGKITHACMMHVCSHNENELCNDASVALVIANVNKTYLTHAAIITFFREFGHAIYHVLGLGHSKCVAVVDYECQFPALLMEELAWDAKVLDFLSKSPIPVETMATYLNSKYHVSLT